MKETAFSNGPEGGSEWSPQGFALGGNKIEDIRVSVMEGLQQFPCPQSLAPQPVLGPSP